MTWHAGADVLAAYHRGDAHPTTTASVEAHLLACALCRDDYSRHAAQDPEHTGVSVDAVWANVVDALDAPKRSLAERLLSRLGVSEPTARLLAATPALRLSWLASILAALGAALTLGLNDEAATLFQLVAAPLLPPLGVAAAYGAAMDPAYEVGAATPVHGLRLVLLRTVAVVVVTVLAGAVMASFLPWSWTTMAWLLPSLGLASATLALGSTGVSALRCAVGVDVAWAVGITMAQDARSPGVEGVGPSTQLAFAAVVIAAAVVVVARRDAMSQEVRP